MNTVEELRSYLNTNYGANKEWPKTFEVSAELYGRCCQAVFNQAYENQMGEDYSEFKIFKIAIGKQRAGLMFRNVELIIKKEEI